MNPPRQLLEPAGNRHLHDGFCTVTGTDSAALPTHRSMVDMCALVRDTAGFVADNARNHHVLVRLLVPAALPDVRGDVAELREAILDLAVRAIRSMAHVESRKRVLGMMCRAEGGQCQVVAVRDTGIVIGDRQSEHTLARSRAVAESHGGRLWCALNDDHGTTVQLLLPNAAGLS
jgi:signal transduction histidine kinase